METFVGRVALGSGASSGVGRSTALLYAKHGSKVIVSDIDERGAQEVGPAFIRTPLISVLEENPETLNMLVSRHPIGRLGEPEEVAELVIWLSSSQASFVTGNFYPVDGGYLAQ